VTLTPLDIHNKEFNRAFRGYSEAEVDEFLDLVVKEFESLIRENAELKDRLDEVERTLERYRSIEETLNKTLVLAQQAAEEARAQGEREAELIRERARADAERIVKEAREQARRAVTDYEEMRREAELFRLRMKTLLRAQLELFEEKERELEEAEGSVFDPTPRAKAIVERYAGEPAPGPTPDDGAGPGEAQAGETGEEAATFELRPGAEVRPNLWGEPVWSTPREPVPRRAAAVEPEDGEERDEQEKGW